MLEISKVKALVFPFGLKSPLFYPGKQTTFHSRGILSRAGRVLIFLMKWEADLQFSLLIKKLEKHLQKCVFSPYFPGCLLPGRGLILHRGQQHPLGERTQFLRLPHSLTRCAMGFIYLFFLMTILLTSKQDLFFLKMSQIPPRIGLGMPH